MFIKKNLGIALSILCICTNRIQSQSYSPKNTKFAFDIHQVIMHPTSTRIIDAIRNANLLPELNWNLPTTILNVIWDIPQLTFYGIKFLYDDGSGEQYYALVKKYGYNELAQTIINIANAQEPITGTVEIMHTLKKLGYTIDIASNIGTTFFKPLEKKYPDIFALTTNTFTVDYIKNTDPISKPNPQYYKNYLQKYGDNKKIIFIDDRKENVDAALQAGMIGILFKNPEQLREDLVKMGIL